MTGLRLDAVVLAAGLGSRFGGKKLTSPWGEGLLIDGALAAAFAAPVLSVVVVTGADPGVIAAAKAYDDGRLMLVYAEDHARGLSASLKAGVAALPGDCEGAFVFLGDMPKVPRGVFAPLAEAVDMGAAAAAPVFHGQRGHPVLFGPALFERLMGLEGDKGANSLLDALGPSLVTIPSPDDGVLFDVDVKPDP